MFSILQIDIQLVGLPFIDRRRKSAEYLPRALIEMERPIRENRQRHPGGIKPLRTWARRPGKMNHAIVSIGPGMNHLEPGSPNLPADLPAGKVSGSGRAVSSR